jgi:hypothetical protein
MVFDLLAIRLVQDRSQSAIVPFLVVSVTPVITGLCVRFFHFLLVFGLIESLHKLITEFIIQVAIMYLQCQETRELYL